MCVSESVTPESSKSTPPPPPRTKKPASSFHEIGLTSPVLTVEKEAPHGSQDTDDLKPAYPDNDRRVKHRHKAGGRLLDFLKTSALLYQKSARASHGYRFYHIACHIPTGSNIHCLSHSFTQNSIIFRSYI